MPNLIHVIEQEFYNSTGVQNIKKRISNSVAAETEISLKMFHKWIILRYDHMSSPLCQLNLKIGKSFTVVSTHGSTCTVVTAIAHAKLAHNPHKRML